MEPDSVPSVMACASLVSLMDGPPCLLLSAWVVHQLTACLQFAPRCVHGTSCPGNGRGAVVWAVCMAVLSIFMIREQVRGASIRLEWPRVETAKVLEIENMYSRLMA